jgi:hypothetical protein
MFGKQLRLKQFFGGIVVTAAVGLVLVPAALSSTSARGGTAGTTQVQANRFTSDTIAPASGYNAGAYVHGGSTPAVAQATQQLGYGRTAAPVATTTSTPTGGSGHNWKPIAIAVLAAALLVLLLVGLRPRSNKPDARTA